MAATAYNAMTNCQAVSKPSTSQGNGLVASFSRLTQLWRTRIREREALASFDDRDLKDLRLSRWDAQREAAKPFWQG